MLHFCFRGRNRVRADTVVSKTSCMFLSFPPLGTHTFSCHEGPTVEANASSAAVQGERVNNAIARNKWFPVQPTLSRPPPFTIGLSWHRKGLQRLRMYQSSCSCVQCKKGISSTKFDCTPFYQFVVVGGEGSRGFDAQDSYNPHTSSSVK